MKQIGQRVKRLISMHAHWLAFLLMLLLAVVAILFFTRY